jgi:hypothetical protein
LQLVVPTVAQFWLSNVLRFDVESRANPTPNPKPMIPTPPKMIAPVGGGNATLFSSVFGGSTG